MIQFQHISFLYTLAVVPLLVLLYMGVLYWRKRRLQKLGDEKLVTSQVQGYIPGRNTFRFILMTIALATIIIGWANLRTGDKSEKAERKGVDVIIALDVSKSMLAKDIQPDRLTRAKQLIMRMTDKMHNDRVALIIFAGRSYLQVPLTVDYTSVKMLLQNVSPDMVPAQGTVIGDAIDMAMKTFTQNEQKYKSLIVITDGEDHDDQAIAKTREAADAGVVVHTVGIGSPQGATLYDPDTKSVKLDENGNPVVSKLNEDELRSIASAGHGTYNLLQNTDEVTDKLISSLEGMEQKSLGSVVYTDYTSYFQYFLLAGFIALIIEWMLPGRKRIKKAAMPAPVGKIQVTKAPASAVQSTAAMLVMFLLCTTAVQAQTNKYILQGNQLYEQQKYKEAADDYAKAVAKDPTNTSGFFNLGNSLYQQKKYDDSRKVMTETAKLSKDKNGAAAANYNIGNTYMSQKKWEDAVNAYKQTLRNNPQDVDAKYNLSYAEQMMKQQQQQQQQQKKQDKQNQDKKDQDKKNQDKKKDDKKDQDKKDQQQQQQDKQDQDKKDQQQGQPSKLSKQQADQLLDALQQEEKKLQDKMQKKDKGAMMKMQKDW